MLGFSPRKAYLPALLLVAAPLALAACGDDDASSDSTSSSSSAASTSGGDGGAGGAGQGGAGGAGGESCVPGEVPAKTIKGTVSFTGTAKKGDSLRIVAFKDGMPGGGAPAGFVFTDAMTPPTFPYEYEFMISLPPEGTGQFGVIAYLDIDSNNVMGAGPEDPSAMQSPLVTVDDCKGAIVDVTLMAP